MRLRGCMFERTTRQTVARTLSARSRMSRTDPSGRLEAFRRTHRFRQCGMSVVGTHPRLLGLQQLLSQVSTRSSVAARESVPNQRFQLAECVKRGSIERLAESHARRFRSLAVWRRLRLHSIENDAATLLATGWHHQITMI